MKISRFAGQGTWVGFGAMVIGMLLVGAPTLAQMSGATKDPGRGDVSTPRAIGGPCRIVAKFTDAFSRRAQEIVEEAVHETIFDMPEPGIAALDHAHTSAFLRQFQRDLLADAPNVAGDIMHRFESDVTPYLDRVAVRICDALVNSPQWLPDPALGDVTARGRTKRALCKALDRYFPRVQTRLLDVAAIVTTSDLSSRLPAIPPELESVMGPGDRDRIVAELRLYVMQLSDRIATDVELELQGFFERTRDRKCR